MATDIRASSGSNDNPLSTRHVVVIGGGIIGTATCFYLMRQWRSIKSNNLNPKSKLKITLIERTGIACHASGKAGGFLASDWCDDTSVGPLAHKSFELHSQIAKEFGANKMLYRRMKAFQMQSQKKSTSTSKSKSKSNENNNINIKWVDCNVDECYLIANETNSAQCHPKYLCQLFVDICCKQGGNDEHNDKHKNNHNNTSKDKQESKENGDNDSVSNFEFNLVYGNVTNLLFNQNKSKVVAVQYEPKQGKDDNDNGNSNSNSSNGNSNSGSNTGVLECDDIVLAMGPWTHKAFDWFPRRLQQLTPFRYIGRINGGKHNSIVLQFNRNGNGNGNNDSSNNDNNENKTESKSDTNNSNNTNNHNDVNCNLPDNTAIFLKHTLKLSNGKDFVVNCEIYPRPDNTVYLCEDHGSGKAKLPATAELIENDEVWSMALFDSLKQVLGSNFNTNKDKLIVKQACFVPSTGGPNGVPMIGKLPNVDNVFIGAGHSCWGILNGPATGKLLAELIIHGKVSLLKQGQFKKFDPSSM